MWARKRVRKIAAFSLVIVGAIALGFSSSVSLRSACGCGSINNWVMSDLKALDARIGQYASAHDGLFPTYDEVSTLYADVDPSQYRPPLTSAVDVATGDLKTPPGQDTGKTLAYAVSADRHSYALRGIGISLKYGHFYFFGWDLGVHIIGTEYPVFKPSDQVPDE